MGAVHPQRQRAWLAARPVPASGGRGPAAVPRGGILRAWGGALRRAIWPDAPVPVEQPEGLDSHELAMAWHRAMHFAGAGSSGTTLDDMLWAARTEGALQDLLLDYRAGKAQSAQEMILAEALDHVARQYLKA